MSNASELTVPAASPERTSRRRSSSSSPQPGGLGLVHWNSSSAYSPRRSADEDTLTNLPLSPTRSRRRTSRVSSMPSEVDRVRRQERYDRKASEASTCTVNSVNMPASSIFPSASISIPTSSKVAGNYGALVASRDDDPNSEENIKWKRKEDEAREIEKKQDQTYKQLLAWEICQNRSPWEKFLSYFSANGKKTPRPTLEKLSELVRHYYPPRCSATAIVYDIYVDHAEPTSVKVGEVVPYFKEKPDEVKLRWIHIPFGKGIPHSSLEEIFCHWGDKGIPFENAARQGFPCLELDGLHFRSKKSFEKMRDIYLILSEDKKLKEELQHYTFEHNQSDLLLKDMEWRGNFVKWDLDYWSLCQSDVPCQLSEREMNPNVRLAESSSLGGPVRGLQKIERGYQKQALSRHPFFQNSVLVNSPFRAFHAADGFLLTMSSEKGVEYIDKNFAENITKPQECLLHNDHASVIAHVMKKFEAEGTQNWQYETAEWFTVYLMTEIAAQPNNNLGGWTAPGLSRAYESIVADLKRRRYQPWEREKNIDLVHEYNNCIDELNVLATIYQKKMSLFTGLVKDCREMKEKYDKSGIKPKFGKDVEPAVDRAKWALKVAQGNFGVAKVLLADLRHSLEALFQIRSIEQNERSVLADHFNKAVYAITVVTVIFLPLSFVASYYGMNIKSVYHSHVSEKYFWIICGPVSLILVVGLLAHNARTRRFFGISQRKLKEANSTEYGGPRPRHHDDIKWNVSRRLTAGMGV